MIRLTVAPWELLLGRGYPMWNGRFHFHLDYMIIEHMVGISCTMWAVSMGYWVRYTCFLCATWYFFRTYYMPHVHLEVILLYIWSFLFYSLWNILHVLSHRKKSCYNKRKCLPKKERKMAPIKGEVRFLLLFDLHASGNMNKLVSEVFLWN